MRMMMTVQMDTVTTNRVIASGEMAEVMKALFDRLTPEGAWFGARDGQRTGTFVFDLKDPSDIPRIAEPLFSVLGAKLELTPVMTREELGRGLEAWSRAR